MAKFHSLSLLQHDRADWQEEPSANVGLVTPPITNPPVDAFSELYSEQFAQTISKKLPTISKPFPAASSKRLPITDELSSPATTRQLSMDSSTSPRATQQLIGGPLYDVTTTQSLVNALQGTMSTKKVASRRSIIIPGEKRPQQRTLEEILGAQRMRLRFRHGIVLAAILLVMITTLLSLTPLGSGQTGSPLFNSVASWVRSQEQNLGIMANITNDQNQAANQAAPPPPPPPVQAALPRSQYVAIAQQAAINAGINPTYFVQQINAESSFNPNAVSPSGAVGIAQMIPSTAAGIGANPYDPVSALNGAARLMAGYAKQYGGDYAKALAAYNAGSGTVDYAIKIGGANWRAYVPAETQNYIYKIMGI